MGFLSSIKTYIAGAIAVIVAGLGIALKILWAQRNRAKKESARLKRRAEEIEAKRKWQRKVHDAENEIRRENREHAQKERDRIDSGDRPDSWSDSRMRGKD